MLLAVAMSEFYENTHVLFIPPDTEYTHMLKIVRGTKHVMPFGANFYKLTKKGWRYLKTHKSKDFKVQDAQIEAFVNSL